MTKRAIWDMTICFAGLGYIVMELWLNIQSPIFATLFVMAAGYELVGALRDGGSRSVRCYSAASTFSIAPAICFCAGVRSFSFSDKG